MKKIIFIGLVSLFFQACTFTITRTDVEIYNSPEAKVEVLQEQKSDTAQSQTANLSAVRGI